MIAIFLVIAAVSVREWGIILGKDAVAHHEQSMYANAFLTMFFAALFFVVMFFFKQDSFVFDAASLPTLITRLFLEVALILTVVKAMVVADRTTFSFVRLLTIPLLLAIDIFIGYDITVWQYAGIAGIIMILMMSFMSQTLSRRGAFLAGLSALIATATTTLYKYNVENYNSVVAEQMIALLVLLSFAFAMTHYVSHEPVRKILSNRKFVLQGFLMGASSVLVSFAFALGTPSVIVAAKRSLSVLAATLSGIVHYHEKHGMMKVIVAIGMIIGVYLLTL